MFWSTVAILLLISLGAASQCCQQLAQNGCLRCPKHMHLYRNNCIFDLPHCIEYQSGFDCSRCQINYHLINSECYHIRLTIDPQLISPFTPYLQSAIKPNPYLNQALAILQNNTEVWLDWLEEKQPESVRLTSSKRQRKESVIQDRILGNMSLLHYIYTATYASDYADLMMFRLTYEVANPSGFSDVLVAVQIEQGQLNYLQIVEVRVIQLEAEGWQPLNPENAAKVQNALKELFDTIGQQLLLKSWCKQTDKGLNITLFYIDDRIGSISYTYAAKSEDLSRLGIRLAGRTNNSSSNNTAVINVTKIQEQINSTLHTNSSSSQTAYNTPPSPSSASSQPSQSTSQSSSASQSSPSTNTASSQAALSNKQLFLNVSTMMHQEMVLAGYAVALKLSYVPSHSTIKAISSFALNNTYCIYFEQNQTQYQFMYQISALSAYLEVVYYSVSSTSTPIPVVTPSSNQSQQQTPTNTKKTIIIPKNSSDQTKPNNQSTPTNNDKNSTTNNTIVNNLTKSQSSMGIPTNPAYNTSAPSNMSVDCSRWHSAAIDITNQIDQDVYMPKINLLLMSMYSDVLKDSRIGEASYSWQVDSTTEISTITYNVTYLSSLNQQYDFQLKVVNNQLQFTKVPSNIKQSGATLPNNTVKAKNSTNASIASVTIKVNGTTNLNQTPTQIQKEPQPQPQEPQTQAQPQVKAADSNIVSNDTSAGQSDNSFLQDTLKKDLSALLPAVANETKQNAQQNDTAKNNSTTPLNQTSTNRTQEPSIIKNLISTSEYEDNPKYKPIVDIIRSIKRVPYNASFDKMMEWTDKNQTYYAITLTMNFTVPLSNGSSQKIFSFNVKVNSSSYVTIVSYNMSFCCFSANADNQTSNSNASGSAAASDLNKTVALKSIGPIIVNSPYKSVLVATLQTHSTALKNMTSKTTQLSSWQSDQGSPNCYSQTIKFRQAAKVLCYQIDYCVTNNATTQGAVRIRKYHVVSCSQQLSNKFLYTLTTAKFTGSEKQSQDVNNLINKIASYHQVTFSHYLQYQNFYFVTYNDSNIADTTILCDVSSLTVLSYCQSPTLIYTPSFKNLDTGFLFQIQKQIQQSFNDTASQLDIIYIEKIKVDNASSLLNIYVIQKSSSWGLQLKKLYYVKAKYIQKLSSINIVNHTLIQGDRPNLISLNDAALSGFFRIPQKSIVNSRQFSSVMKQINIGYSSFLQSSNVSAVLVHNQQQLQRFLNDSWSYQVSIKIVITKKYANSYGSYVISASYVPANDTTDLRGIEVVSADVIRATNCNVTSVETGLPLCSQCISGYKLVNDKCVEQINDCEEYYSFWCLRCAQSQVINNLSQCSKVDSIGTEITDLNTYMVALGQDR